VTPLDAKEIMRRAREAQPAWAALEVRRRSEVLGRLRRELAKNCESIAELISRETAKPQLDALAGDVLVTLEAMRYYEGHAAKILRARRVGKPAIFFRGASFETHFEPHGVALIFGAANYPLQLSMIPLITALTVGNAAVLKCSERTPETAALIARLCMQAGLPEGLVQVFRNGPEEAVALIDARPDIIFFTGSSRNGQMVAERAAKYLIPVVLELGGKDASLVFADCNLERAVEGITYGAFSNGGRVCVGVKRAYVEEPIFDEFIAKLKRRVAGLRVASEADADFYPVSAQEAEVLRAQVDDALARGATLQYPQDCDAVGCKPVLLTGVPADAHILEEECFGPVLCIGKFVDEADAIALANGSAFALSSSVWTRNRARARRVAARLSAGSCAVNDTIRVIANPYAPFGGNRHSGHGRYHGPDGLHAFSRTKTILFAGDRRRKEINWFPFSERTRRQLAGLLRFRHGHIGLAARLNRIVMPLVLGAILSVGLPAQSKPETHLTIDVKLTPNAHGELAYLVFDSPSGFPDDRKTAVRHGFLPIPADAREMHIELELPPGVYAASVYEDLNGNHKLDRSFFGIPREPVGASNNPKGRMGPPRFNESSFRVGPAPQTIVITLVETS
jgi:4,4'-diapolycopenoate synthase